MRILSLDQSSKIIGYSIFIEGTLLKADIFSLKEKASLSERLVELKEKLTQLIQYYQIDFLLMEDIQLQDSVNNNVKTFKTLAEVMGVIEELCGEIKMPYEKILASTWKSKLGIKGKMRKEQKRNAQLYVKNKYSISLSEDACDSICIGDCYLTQQAYSWE